MDKLAGRPEAEKELAPKLLRMSSLTAEPTAAVLFSLKICPMPPARLPSVKLPTVALYWPTRRFKKDSGPDNFSGSEK